MALTPPVWHDYDPATGIGNPDTPLSGAGLTAAMQAFADDIDTKKANADSVPINVKDYGAVGDGVADDASAIQAACNAAAAAGGRVYGHGTYKIGSTVTIKGAADFGDAVFNYAGTGIAVQVGDPSSLLWRSIIVLPDVIATAKTVPGWAQVAGLTGVRMTNLYSCFVTVPHIKNFETGLHMHGQSPNGSSYNTIYLGQTDNNKVNILVSPQDSGSGATSGWVNQNTYLGGRCSHNSNEGTQTAGTRHILIVSASNAINNNVFYGTSLESPNVVEYHIECAGWYNFFDRCRWENTTPAYRRVLWTTPAKGNVISGGMYAADIIASSTSPYTNNEIKSDAAWTAYVPILAQGGTPVSAGTGGSITGRYKMIDGKTVHYEIRLVVGTGTSFSTSYFTITLPFTHQNGNVDVVGTMYGSIAGVLCTGVATKATTTTTRVVVGSAYLSGTVPGAMSSGDTVAISGTYEVA